MFGSANTGVGGGSGFTFGTQPAQQQPPMATPTAFPSFGTTPTPAQQTGFTFGGPPAQTSQPATIPVPSTFSLGGITAPVVGGGGGGSGFTFGAGVGTSLPTATIQPQSTTAAPSSFNFGGVSSTTTTTSGTIPVTGFSFGAITTTQQPPQPATTTTTFTNFGGIPQIQPISTSQQQQQKQPQQPQLPGFRQDERIPKESAVPQELLMLIDEFKTHVKGEKLKLTEISKSTTTHKNIEKLSEEIDEARSTVASAKNLIHRNSIFIDVIRKQTIEEMSNLEMANLTHELPHALNNDFEQHTSYFNRLVKDFENRMAIFQREVIKAEETVNDSAKFVSGNYLPQQYDLVAVLKATRDTVIALAAKVQSIHEKLGQEIEKHKANQRLTSGESEDLFGYEKSHSIYPSSIITETPIPSIPQQNKLLHDNMTDQFLRTNLYFPTKILDTTHLFKATQSNHPGTSSNAIHHQMSNQPHMDSTRFGNPPTGQYGSPHAFSQSYFHSTAFPRQINPLFQTHASPIPHHGASSGSFPFGASTTCSSSLKRSKN